MIELVTVIVLLGVVLVAAGPRFFDNRVFTERGYVDQLAASLRYAQRVAIASGCNVRVIINAAGHSAAQRNNYLTCTTASAWNRPVRLTDGSTLSAATPAGVAVTPAVLQFNRDGSLLVAAPPITVGSFTLLVDSTTGRVTVQ